MRTRKKELDVDFIGGMGSLTKEEEKRISEAIKMLKEKKGSAYKKPRKLTAKKNTTV